MNNELNITKAQLVSSITRILARDELSVGGRIVITKIGSNNWYLVVKDQEPIEIGTEKSATQGQI